APNQLTDAPVEGTKAEHAVPSWHRNTTGVPMNSLVPDPSNLSAAHRETTLPPVPFGPAPLIEGEDAGAYDELLLRISAAVRPHDIFEEIWVRDIVDLVWEAFRLRRFKACLVTAGACAAL